MTLHILEFTTRLALAFGLGAVIGIERQYRQKSAGLRTNTLVATGAAAFILLSVILTAGTDDTYRGDATRIAGQIVTGIGFLGAGVIMKNGLSVQGLNTAATIWCSAAVGTLSGAGLVLEACITTAFIVLAHTLLRSLGARINRLPLQKEENGVFYYYLRIRCKEQVENHLRVLLLNELKKEANMQLQALKSSDNESPNYAYIEANILANGRHDISVEQIAGKLTLEYGVSEVRWEVSGKSEEL